MKKNLALVFAFVLAACGAQPSAPTSTATATFTPPPTAIPDTVTPDTATPSPTPTETPMPTAEMTLVPFTAERAAQIANSGFDVAAWMEENPGVPFTPELVMANSDPVTEWNSERLVTGFWIPTNSDGSQTVCVKVDGKIKSMNELPFKYEVVYLKNADGIEPSVFEEFDRKSDNKRVHDWLAIILKINTVGGELKVGMGTHGAMLDYSDLTEVIEGIAGENFEYPATPAFKTKKADVLGSRLAGEIANLNKIAMGQIQRLLETTDLSDPAQFRALQEKLNKTWLIMGSMSTVKGSVQVEQ